MRAVEKLEDLRMEAVARRRLRTLHRSKTVSHREMMQRFGSAQKSELRRPRLTRT
jgi:hypothetical protein